MSIRLGAALLVALVPLASGCQREEVETVPPPEVGTEIGNTSPGLAGSLADGSAFDLGDSLSGNTVLVFYRTAHCGLCRLQLEQIQRHLTAYEYQDARVVGVTLDPPQTSEALLREVEIGFDLVSVDRAVFDAWGVTRPGVEAPLPATFVLDADGIVRFKHIGRNAADRASDAGILTVLETLGR